jgi:hypothetical protein
MTHCQNDADRTRCCDALETALGRTPLYVKWRSPNPCPDRSIDECYAALPSLSKADIRVHFPEGLVPEGMDLDAGLA